jgi:hypothetical protein
MTKQNTKKNKTHRNRAPYGLRHGQPYFTSHHATKQNLEKPQPKQNFPATVR